ncbi:phosphopantetheinyl transferase [Pandoraea capi]|uniref:Phosphopantetheinyl transferase n=1 Tax=Pandoraea capi TaxID=2508286 RepID=A0ABY6W7W8_9BURK|nr:4'-phosphopantetheinyl transferase superfamily protein [Pandoraea capi]VVE37384.1 phosphopantetheinyl transferase [Pandoraea capi]
MTNDNTATQTHDKPSGSEGINTRHAFSTLAGLTGLALYGTSASVLARFRGWTAHLTPDERKRADAFSRPADRDDYVAAHILARVAAARVTGCSDTPGAAARTYILVQRCEQCGGAHGRPRLPAHPGLHVSLSHTRGAVAAACAIAPVGIDIEHWDEALSLDIDLPGVNARERSRLGAFASVAFTHHAPSPRALAWLRLWTRKESLVKVGGTTLESMSAIDLSGLPMSETPLRVWQRRVTHDIWSMTDWLDPMLRITGTVSGAGNVSVERIDG